MSVQAVKHAQYLNAFPAKMIWYKLSRTYDYFCQEWFEYMAILQKNLKKPLEIYSAGEY